MNPVDEQIHRLMGGSISDIFLQVMDEKRARQIVGRSHYWATRSQVGIKTRYNKQSKMLRIWRTHQ